MTSMGLISTLVRTKQNIIIYYFYFNMILIIFCLLPHLRIHMLLYHGMQHQSDLVPAPVEDIMTSPHQPAVEGTALSKRA